MVAGVRDEDGDESDADSDIMDECQERNLLTESSILCLNSTEFVSGIVRIVETLERNKPKMITTFTGQTAARVGQGSENIRSICIICHQLLLYNQQVNITSETDDAVIRGVSSPPPKKEKKQNYMMIISSHSKIEKRFSH